MRDSRKEGEEGGVWQPGLGFVTVEVCKRECESVCVWWHWRRYRNATGIQATNLFGYPPFTSDAGKSVSCNGAGEGEPMYIVL